MKSCVHQALPGTVMNNALSVAASDDSFSEPAVLPARGAE